MNKLFLSSALALTLSACVVSGHPSTDRHHSHVDNSSTRYYSDGVDRHYDDKDQTKYKYNKYQRDKLDHDYDRDDTIRYDRDGDGYYDDHVTYNNDGIRYKQGYRTYHDEY